MSLMSIWDKGLYKYGLSDLKKFDKEDRKNNLLCQNKECAELQVPVSKGLKPSQNPYSLLKHEAICIRTLIIGELELLAVHWLYTSH